MFDPDTWPVVTTYPGAPIAAFDTIEQALAVAAGLAKVQLTAPTRRSRPAAERSAA